MFQMLGLIAEFERSMIRDRVVCGMVRARTTGTKSGRAIGRPTITNVTRDAICGLLGAGQSERAIVAAARVSKGAVGRVRAAMAAMVPREG
jgi:DNA invertase Pin-like site-specific DNA recombinase